MNRSKWISIEDSNPPYDKEVIYIAVDWEFKKHIVVGRRKPTGWTHECMAFTEIFLPPQIEVTHWINIPELPEDD